MFEKPGAVVLVDGQYGSTGKGVMSQFIAEKYGKRIDMVISNAGPNSGHTSYVRGEQVILKQLPTSAVGLTLMGKYVETYLSAGAIIDFDILNREVEKYGVPVYLAAQAAVITEADKVMEHSGSVAAVAGTRQGVGAALARKVLRDPTAIVRNYSGEVHPLITIVEDVPPYLNKRIFMEVSQGFSLGINSRFYPKVTSRECSVSQAMADARMSPLFFNESVMCVRTFPIRVGNVDGHSSGDCYPDQEETTWETLGQPPELTTVTKRVRRVFTFSLLQFSEALMANTPRTVFLNFMNYVPQVNQQRIFVHRLRTHSRKILGREPEFLMGFGPRSEHVRR